MDRIVDSQMENLKTKLIKMCSLVDEQVALVVESVENEDLEKARLVIEHDTKVDKYDIKIDRICQTLFALNQPVAMDLRFIMSAMKINSNLERIGDLAVNIARGFLDIGKKPDFYDKLNFSEIASLAKRMINNAIDAFIHSNSELAKNVIKFDDKVDDLTRSEQNKIVEFMKDSPENIESGLIFHKMMYSIERMADHSTNISEEVYFIVNAESVKHQSDSEEFQID